eukprot:51619_1
MHSFRCNRIKERGLISCRILFRNTFAFNPYITPMIRGVPIIIRYTGYHNGFCIAILAPFGVIIMTHTEPKLSICTDIDQVRVSIFRFVPLSLITCGNDKFFMIPCLALFLALFAPFNAYFLCLCRIECRNCA